ncbi:Regulator of sigma D [Raoultella ornithinolytica]|nr:Regulator of sigma D [Raoultella ornithinolytica]
MLNQLENLTERVGGSNELVDRWLHVRKHLLVAYYKLVGLKPGKESFMRLNEKALDSFCQSLVDYLSSGHFSIYERILGEMEGDTPLLAAPDSIRSWKPIPSKLWITTTPASKMLSIMIIILSSSRRCPISAKRWKPALRWKIS